MFLFSPGTVLFSGEDFDDSVEPVRMNSSRRNRISRASTAVSDDTILACRGAGH